MSNRGARFRLLCTAALLLLLGGVVNVLVAWGCVIAAPSVLPRTTAALASESVYEPYFPLHPLPGWSFTQRQGVANSCRGLIEIRVDQISFARNGTYLTTSAGHIWRAGWPFYSVACATTNRSNSVHGGIRVPGLTASAPSDPPRPLPCTPDWPGFAINALLYANVVAFGYAGFRWVRSRHLPGCCRSCGYDLHGNVGGVCPECGGKV